MTYYITANAGVGVWDASEVSQGPQTFPFSAVATREGLQVGGFYLGLTRDDMGGLKYLYSKNRYVNEGLDTEASVVPNFTTTWDPYVSNTVTPNAVFTGLFGGVDKITFVKTPYDSVLGNGYVSNTYRYTLPWVTNGQLRQLSVMRIVTAPDIVFYAGKMVFPGPDAYETTLARSATFITSGERGPTPVTIALNPVVYPDVKAPEMSVILNDVGPIYYNIAYGYNAQDQSPEMGFVWSSFDGSTNPPVLFPDGTSLEEIEGQVLSAGPEYAGADLQPGGQYQYIYHRHRRG